MSRSRRPNVLFILSDQHNPHVLGCTGNRVIRTPRLDQLAREGAVFDNTYCQNPLCVPSRCSLITGQYSKTLGIYGNREILDPSSVTIPRVFSEAGYRTCLIGKAHFNGEQYQGYQERPYGDLWGQAHQPDPVRTSAKGDAGLGEILEQAGPSGIPRLLTQTEICSFETVKWLQLHTARFPEQPFFLSLHYDKPHFPINPPRNYFEYYKNKVKLPAVPKNYLKNLPPSIQSYYEREGYHKKSAKLHLKTLAAYYGCVEWIDTSIGHVLDALKYLGLEDNTIVIYTSDHGEMAGEHHLWQKFLFFEASARVPLMIRWPGKVRSASRYRPPVGLLDLFPTLCEAARISTPKTCEGISLLPLLTKNRKLHREHIFSETFFPVGEPAMAGCMIRTDRWKYNFYLDGSDELYDLERDPNEWHNLAKSKPHQKWVKKLRGDVVKFWKPDEFSKRYTAAPRVRKNKHTYWFSNQYVLDNGMVVDARP